MNDAGTIAKELDLPSKGVAKAVELLSEGNTVPFLARYRKEATGGLDEVQIRAIEARLRYLQELSARRQTIEKAIDEQGKLSEGLRSKLEACTTKAGLEDLYLPYKKKRRTRAAMARERGLEPLARLILKQGFDGNPRGAARAYLNPSKDVPDVETALAGARDIVAETLSDRADLRGVVREAMKRHGQLVSKVIKKKRDEEGAARFKDYFDHEERASRVPSHRFLAMARAEREGFVRVKLDLDTQTVGQKLRRLAGHRPSSPFEEELDTALGDAFKRLISPSISAEILGDLKARSEDAAIDVFAQNLRNLLLASPAGTKPVIGLDPGLRTGCKTVALGATGRFIENRTLYIVGSDAEKARAGRDLLEMVERHSPFAVVIGNGTGGREAQAFVKTTLAQTPHSGLIVLQVSEAGASIYSASDVARLEFPDLDLTVRGAISIGRRFQDPLAELVKLDPKAIGVGQYQHDVNQSALQRKLSEVVEDCVNQVGVALNTASAQLLAHVAGIGPKLAQNIVAHREDTGPFSSRRDLLSVPKLGKKTFEQAAGFLRISGGKEPLDASSVHPERYALVKRMAADVGTGVGALLGDPIKADRIPLEPYLDSGVGAPTLRDIIAELKKPGRDPRATFEAPSFRQDIHSMKDLKAGMHFEGVVTNVTAFGAFVDIGVHQDGLVHISQLADSFVRDPHQVVHVGQAIKVSVLEVDLRRGRISLSARSNQKARSRA